MLVATRAMNMAMFQLFFCSVSNFHHFYIKS